MSGRVNGSGLRDAFTHAGLFPHAAATAHGVTP
jgi:hypothetical protein